ncbi:DUF1127 domain-containing protein [Paracraurococcus ruber]|uniref:DUF1127 domain-containing protein n=1 Tax=Paracraurococcus ruber TaxID=77675 RepID=UPI0010578C09|nr:DUF1127 domain-containing protein [Paracraurococcus ruber]TDG02676.1 DUF1127 domain-containing protein [Paracraurococcus ruber]
MSITVTGFRPDLASPGLAPRPAPGAGLFGRLRRWLRQRRDAAILAGLDQRLREDAGLPPAAAPLVRLPSRLHMG